MKKLKISMLSWLLHHANRNGKNEHFYKIKNELLKKYGVFIGYDVQFIEGKKCYSCGGTGNHPKYSYTGKVYDYADCYHCIGGWYKLPTWNILQKMKFGKYVFHQPFKRVHKKPDIYANFFTGYVEHFRSKHTDFALKVLFLLYEKGYLKRWYKEAGIGWFTYWWLPQNWLSNFIHILKHGTNSLPFRKKD